MVFPIYEEECTLFQAQRPRENKCVCILSYAKSNPLYPSFQKMICYVSGYDLIERFSLMMGVSRGGLKATKEVKNVYHEKCVRSQ